jgi:tetratricopeptide (TPR) repeat protein
MWSPRPVFVSSTFQDMQAERDHLRNFVFPALEERLRRLYQHLEWVDLRIGIATASRTEDQREEQVLAVCLSEVRRCRPFLVVLLGDRYGWVPPADRSNAAAAEAGLEVNPAGRSVTDLEIELGVLSDATTKTRSLFYFRDSLPYARLAPDVIALYAEDDNRERLTALKNRIQTALPDRVHHYTAVWDEAAGCVSGLEGWGQRVIEELWAELESAAIDARPTEISWTRAERNALEEFVEDRGRDFVGRESVLARLKSHADSLPNDAASRGVCVTGASGLGKSALFSNLYRELRRQDVFVLAHAAAASVRSRSVDSMLRRWIEELALALNVDVTLSDGDDAEREVDAAFARLLGQLAARERVTVLVDALDQLDPASRGRFARWLPRDEHLNTRFIATAVAGDASEALAGRGFELLPLPPLDAPEARGIVEKVSARYHRQLEPKVIEALLAKTGMTGFAWASPLWVTLAAERLNLIDADDFARAKRFYDGTHAERAHALMLHLVADLPSDIPALYAATFEHATKLFGARLVEAWLSLIAVGRGGWREGDFRMLLPSLTGEAWDELRFAQLRRVFRGQVRQHGALGQWDFDHDQMRDAVRERILLRNQSEAAVHAAVVDHLLTLSPEDPLRERETMVHLLGSRNWRRAIHYYGDDALTPAELRAASEVLARAALTLERGAMESGLEQVFHMLEPGGADWGSAEYAEDLSYQEYAAQRLLHLVFELLRSSATLELREVFARRVGEFFDGLFAMDPELRARSAGHSAAARSRLGEVQAALGNTAGAVASYNRSIEISEWLAREHPDRLELQRDHSVVHNQIGKLQVQRGDLTAAAASFDAARTIMQRVVRAQPDDRGWQHDLAITHVNVGDVSIRQGDVTAAEAAYQAALAIEERLSARDPASSGDQAGIAMAQSRIAHAKTTRGDLAAAEASFRAALSVYQRLVDQEPENLLWLESLFVSLEGLGATQKRRGYWTDAELSLRNAVAICERLVARDDQNIQWQKGLSANTLLLAGVSLVRGSLDVAERASRQSVTVADRLARNDPGNPELQGELARRYLMSGGVQVARGDLSEAERSCQSVLAIARQLPADSPGLESQMMPALVDLVMGDIQLARGNLAAAEKSVRAGLTILSVLANSDPDNWEVLQNLTASYGTLGEALRRQGNLAAAEESFETQVALAERLAARDPDNIVLLRGSFSRFAVPQKGNAAK